MISANMVFDVEDKDVHALLLRLAVTTSPVALGEFLRHGVHDFLQVRAAERFAGEGDNAVGGKWKPLAESTRRFRQYHGFTPDHPINRRTGELENYITNGAAQVITDPAGATLAFPGNAENFLTQKKIRTAQKGDARTPARPVLGYDHQDVATILVGLGQFIQRGEPRAGLHRA